MFAGVNFCKLCRETAIHKLFYAYFALVYSLHIEGEVTHKIKCFCENCNSETFATSISSLKKSWGASDPKLEILAVQWLCTNLKLCA